MVRSLSLIGFGSLFLMISPGLRAMALDGFATVVGGIEKYSPWSYIGAAAGLLLGLAISAYRASAPG